MRLDEAQERTRGFIGEFKKFAMRGNVIDLAVGVVIGAAFGAIVNSIVGDIITPVIGIFTGQMNFKDRFWALDGKEYESFEAAKKATSVIRYGNFIDTVIQFIIVAFVLFLVVRQINRLTKPQGPPPVATTKDCPFCFSVIPLKATRCAHCTSQLT